MLLQDQMCASLADGLTRFIKVVFSHNAPSLFYTRVISFYK